MRKINFQHVVSKGNIIFALILLVCVIINILMVFEYNHLGNEKFQKMFSAFTSIVCVIFISRIFWYRNVFQWNKKGFTARINNFWGVNKKFKDISKIEFLEDRIFLIDIFGNKEKISLENIEVNSKSKLTEILKSNIR